MTRIRVVTVNTGKGDGPFCERIDWLIAELDRLDPSIVACQEVFASAEERVDTAGKLAGALGMHLVWSPARAKDREFGGCVVKSVSGLALLSRLPWEVFETIDLPSDDRDGDRVAQVARTAFDGVGIVVANVHLTHLRGARRLRWRQLAEVATHEALDDSSALRFVCGDFNAASCEPEISAFTVNSGGQLFDTWSATDPDHLRGTLARNPAGPRIDYVFAVGNHPAVEGFEDSGVVLNRPHPRSGVFPSDHFGVTTTAVISGATA